MAKLILMDEFFLTIMAPRGLNEAACKAIWRTLNNRRFQSDLRRAVRAVFSRYRTLRAVRLKLAR